MLVSITRAYLNFCPYVMKPVVLVGIGLREGIGIRAMLIHGNIVVLYSNNVITLVTLDDA